MKNKTEHNTKDGKPLRSRRNINQASLTPSVYEAINNAVDSVKVDKGFMFAMAKQESSFDPAIKAKTSTASGLYQFIDSKWQEMVKKYGSQYNIKLSDRFDPNANAIMGALLTKDNELYLKKNGIDPSATDLYLAHFLGARGAAHFLTERKKNANVAASSLVSRVQAAANKSVFYDKDDNDKPRTADEVYVYFENRVGKEAAKFNEPDAVEKIFSINTKRVKSFDTNDHERPLKQQRINVESTPFSGERDNGFTLINRIKNIDTEIKPPRSSLFQPANLNQKLAQEFSKRKLDTNSLRKSNGSKLEIKLPPNKKQKLSSSLEDFKPRDPIKTHSNPKSAFHVGIGNSSTVNPDLGFTHDSENGWHHNSVNADTTYYINGTSNGLALGITKKIDSENKLLGLMGAATLGLSVIIIAKKYWDQHKVWESLSPKEKARYHIKSTIGKYVQDREKTYKRYFDVSNWGKNHEQITKKNTRNTFDKMEKFLGDLGDPELKRKFRYLRYYALDELNNQFQNIQNEDVDHVLEKIDTAYDNKIKKLTNTGIQNLANHNYKEMRETADSLMKAEQHNSFSYYLYAEISRNSKQNHTANEFYTKAEEHAANSSQRQFILEERLKFNLENEESQDINFSQEFEQYIQRSNNSFRQECVELCLDSDKLAEAEFICNTMVSDKSSNQDDKCWGFIHLGKAKEKVNKSDEALENFKKASEHQALSPELVHYCTHKLYEYGISASEEAYNSAKHGVKIDPSNKEAEITLANCALRTNNIEEAKAIGEKFLTHKDSNNDLYQGHKLLMQVGKLKSTLDDLRTALEHSKQAEALSPNDSEMIAEQAKINFLLEDYKSTFNDCARYLTLNPNHPELKYLQGVSLLHTDVNSNNAEDIFRQLVHDKDMKNNVIKSDSYRMLGHIKSKNNQDPYKDFKRAIATNPKNFEAHDDLGMLYLKHEQYANAEGHFRKCMEGRKDGHDRAKAALTIFKQGRVKEAKDMLNQDRTHFETFTIPTSISANYVCKQEIRKVQYYKTGRIVGDIAFMLLKQCSNELKKNASSKSMEKFATTASFLCDIGIKEYIWGAWERSHYDQINAMESMISKFIPVSDPNKLPGISSKIGEDLRNLKNGIINIPGNAYDFLSHPISQTQQTFKLDNLSNAGQKLGTALGTSSKILDAIASHDLCSEENKQRIKKFSTVAKTVQTANSVVHVFRGFNEGRKQISETIKKSGRKRFFSNAKPGFKKIGNASLIGLQVADVLIDFGLSVAYPPESTLQPDHLLVHAGRAAIKSVLSFDVSIGASIAGLIGGPVIWGFLGWYVFTRILIAGVSLETQAKLTNVNLLITQKNFPEADRVLQYLEASSNNTDDNNAGLTRLGRINYFIANEDINNAEKKINEFEIRLRRVNYANELFFGLLEKKLYIAYHKNDLVQANNIVTEMTHRFREEKFIPDLNRIKQIFELQQLSGSYDQKQYKQAISHANKLLNSIITPTADKDIIMKSKESILTIKLNSLLSICETLDIRNSIAQATKDYQEVVIFINQNTELEKHRSDALLRIASRFLQHQADQPVIELTQVAMSQTTPDIKLMLFRSQALFNIAIKESIASQNDELKLRSRSISKNKKPVITRFKDNLKIKEALILLNGILLREPNNEGAHELLAMIADSSNEPSKALLHYEQAISILRNKISLLARSKNKESNQNQQPSLNEGVIQQLQEIITNFENNCVNLKQQMEMYKQFTNKKLDEIIYRKNIIAIKEKEVNRYSETNYQKFEIKLSELTLQYEQLRSLHLEWKEMFTHKENFLSPEFILKLRDDTKYEISLFQEKIEKKIHEYSAVEEADKKCTIKNLLV